MNQMHMLVLLQVPGQRAKFHVDWKSVRPEAHIMPYTDRQKEEQVKVPSIPRWCTQIWHTF